MNTEIGVKLTTDYLIETLRNIAQYGNTITELDRSRMNQAADRLEELDERVAIMAEPTAQDAMDNIGEAFEKFCQATGGETHGSGQDHGGDPAEMRT